VFGLNLDAVKNPPKGHATQTEKYQSQCETHPLLELLPGKDTPML